MSSFVSGSLPGQQSFVATADNQVQFFGPSSESNAVVLHAIFDATSVDAGNTPSTTLRSGLVLAKVTATNRWKPYDPTANDGTQIAAGVLLRSISMLDAFGTASEKYTGRVLVAGNVRKASLIGLTPDAQSQLIQGGIIFDEHPMGAAAGILNHAGQISVGGNTVVSVSQNGRLFVASAAADFTLPPIQAGLAFGFLQSADGDMRVLSAAGDDVLATGNSAADGVAYGTNGQKIGSLVQVRATYVGAELKWFVANLGGTTMTVISS